MNLQIEKEGTILTLPELEQTTGAAFVPILEFSDEKILADLRKKSEKLHKKGMLAREQLWLGAYFRNEILSNKIPDVCIRWIDSSLGWGVFAMRDFKKMEFIAEYTGTVRKRQRADQTNAYCFEYIVAQGVSSPYLIDAREQGGLSRFINHSGNPNLLSALATLDHISHIVLYTSQPISKGTQLCYDYGPDYWAHRPKPKNILENI